ncbi:hypothetical protein TRFO_36094 [Tritrichomonas foetus]|uniref:Uncharacterized protein n=1 Tax=Tritrichomonas foetus TaxID=1144522 RepID=A0A1J4JET2_9EUKA|nr:hypothetical protein TRFO_36094 [Tritrichomonas foetus]|eukprot:OHS97666.1 hypothetical protein TRFO_36094 [Tritrichomonas foetus]
MLQNDEINEVIQKALFDADSKKNRNNEDFEKEMLPGTYVIGQWIIELAHPLTGPTAREIQGYSTSQNYYAIVVDKSKIYDSATVITDPVEQKYYILEEEIRKVELESDMANGREIRVFNKKEIDKMQVFTRVQMNSRFEVKANEQDELCEIGLSGVDCTKSFSYQWDEANDQPQLKDYLNGKLQAGVGVISSFTFDVDMDLYWAGFYLKAEIGARLEAGALIEIPAEIEIGSVKLFEQAFNLLNGLTSLSLFGTSIGLTLKIGVAASIKDIKITFGKPIRYYKGYEITVSKVYTLSSETGFEQSKWITSVNPKNDEFNLKSAVDNLLTEIMLRASPTLSLSLTLAVEWGSPFASIGVRLDFSVPMSFGLDFATCSMPYVAGSIGLSLDAVLNIPEIKLSKFTIFDGYKQSYNIFSVDSGTMCLYDPNLNVEEKENSYISKIFDTDNLIYFECTAGSSNVNLNLIVQVDTNEGSLKRDLMYLQVKPNNQVQFSYITLDKNLDPKITVYIQNWGAGSSVETKQIFQKNLGQISETEDISSSELEAYCKLKLIKIQSKDVDFGKYIDQDTNVKAITFKAKTSSTSIGEKYIPISFNDKITVQETYYYPVYQNPSQF